MTVKMKIERVKADSDLNLKLENRSFLVRDWDKRGSRIGRFVDLVISGQIFDFDEDK